MTAKKIKALVMTGYGINCDKESKFAVDMLKQYNVQADRVHINDLIKGEVRLDDYQMLLFAGGFSFGDDLGAGKVYAVKMKHNLGDEINEFINKDKLVMGYCNGFQAMIKYGILPGFDNDYETQAATLTTNDSAKYEDRWVNLKKTSDTPKVLKDIDMMYLPVAHGEGKFYAPDEVLDRLEKEGLVAMIYANENGEAAKGEYPLNPNGSLNDIAGICDPTGRIFGMMPHPERFLHITNHPNWTKEKETLKRKGENIKPEGEGVKIFKNAVEYFM